MVFDWVVVDGERMTAESFQRVPSRERVKWILDGKVTFYNGIEIVEERTALEHLREADRKAS